MKKRSIFALLIMYLWAFAPADAQNLLNLQDWLPGTGGITGFAATGLASENVREWGDGPFGQRTVLWKAVSDGNNDGDGGWTATPISINPLAMYRFAVWVKKGVSHDGYSYLGCDNVTHLDGTPETNPYFWYGDLPALNKWYLIVGYIHGSNDASTTHYGGIYDGQTGQKVVNCTDFKFQTNASTTHHRSFLFYCANPNVIQYFYAPRIDLVNGNEPTISELLGLSNIGASGSTNFMGKVGIMTTTPGDYELAVNGKIRTQSIRVETANWPDYVFDSSYRLMSLKETNQFIKVHKHLPGIPSAGQVEKEGVELSSNQALLLKKIEELTLYMIELKKENEGLQKEVTGLKKAILKK